LPLRADPVISNVEGAGADVAWGAGAGEAGVAA
jgi:hypothetical protein